MKTTLSALCLLFINVISCSSLYANGPVLPITLGNLRAVITVFQQVDVSWATMMESNIDHYEIQRSSDGIDFQNIDSIASKMQITTNEYQLQYSYSDKHPLTGISYYRIKIIGRNGMTNQSIILQITNDIRLTTRFFPGIVQNNIINVETDKIIRTAKIEFFDLKGKKISETNLTNLSVRQTVEISRSGTLVSGTYVARLTSDGQQIKTQLIIVQH